MHYWCKKANQQRLKIVVAFLAVVVTTMLITACKVTPRNPNSEKKSFDGVAINFKNCQRNNSTVTCIFIVRSIAKQKHLFIHYQTSALDDEGNLYCIAQVKVRDITETNNSRCEDHSTAGLLKPDELTDIHIVFENVSATATMFPSIDFRAFAGRNRDVRVLSYVNIELVSKM